MQYIQTKVEDSIFWITLDRPKANALNHQMVKEIRQALQEADEQELGVIITGKAPFFSAGLDVIELFQYDKPKMRAFFTDFLEMYQDIVCYPEPLICAVTGHCPAGGTVITLGADYRVMATGNFHIGLNEMAVNIQITDALIRGYQFWIGTGKAHEAIIEGKMFSPQEAFANGLVQEITDLAKVDEQAKLKMKQYQKLDRQLFRQTKAKLRKDWMAALLDSDPEEIQMTESNWWRPDIRKKMEFFIRSLQTKKN